MTAIKITITMQPAIVKKLDRVRGDVKRSTYISRLVRNEAEKNV